jgi:hypothetical protein
VRDRPTRLYKEDARTGEWSALDGEEIHQFVEELNPLGVRESRLKSKIVECLQSKCLATEGAAAEDVTADITGETAA